MHHPTPIIYRIVDSFFRYKLRFFLALAIVSLLVTGVMLTRPKEFVANGLVQIIDNTRMAKVMGDTNSYGWKTPAQVHMANFNNRMHDDEPNGFLDRALKTAKLSPPIDLKSDKKDPRLEAILKNLSAGTDTGEVFTISLTYANANETERLVRAFRNEYIESYSDDGQADSVATSAFLDQQIIKYKKMLQDADNALAEFKGKFSGRLPDQQNAQAEQLSLLRTDLDTLEINNRNQEIQLQFLTQQLKRIKPKIIADTTYQNTPTTTSGMLQQATATRNTLISSGYKKESTLVRKADKEIARLNKVQEAEQKQQEEAARKGRPNGTMVETRVQDNPAYTDTVTRIMELESEQRVNTTKIASTRARIAQYEAQMKQLPMAERKLNERLRDRDVINKVYTDLKERKYQADIQAGKDKRIGKAMLKPLGTIHAEATAGKKKLIIGVVAAAVLGLIMGGLCIFVSEWLDSSLRYAGDTESVLGVPVLAALPEARELGFRLALPSAESPGENEGGTGGS